MGILECYLGRPFQQALHPIAGPHSTQHCRDGLPLMLIVAYTDM